MSETVHFEVAVAVLALMRAKRASSTQISDVLRSRERLGSTLGLDARTEDVLSLFGVDKPSINGTLASARELLEKSLALGIRPLHLGHSDYPPQLRSIVDAPPLIHVRGDMKSFRKLPGVAIVGTRNATAHGLTIAQRIAAFIGAEGYPVISGLALGIDAAAHEGALQAGAPTIAVLAHGLKAASPKTNAHLAQRILDQGGAWVSEHAIDVSARPEYFVHRNRIQVGLSCASIIVEGQEKSGSMTQAEFCLRNRRALFAVLPDKGTVTVTQHELPTMLVRLRGATPIRSKDDYPLLLQTVRRKAEELREVP